jgi:tape measure domain-containing protein
MATIKTAIQLYNGMSPALQSMSTAMNMVISSFETMQNVSSRAVDTQSLQAARAELNKAEAMFQQVEKAIQGADQAQQRLNKDMREGQKAAEGILNKIKGWAAAAGAAFGAKQIIEMSDEMALTKARLDLMNDGLQTTVQLQEMIFESAQRARTSFLDTAQVVSKLGILASSAFSSNKEMIRFAELMNKQFKIGGASLQEQTAAMYQLTQAMAAGRLQGDEFRSIMENAPMLAQAIADHMGKTTGELREMSSQGLITADVIKRAMFEAAEETNRRFEELPMTWGQVWTTTLNNILYYSQPLLDMVNLIANNWSTIAPIFWGLASAVGVYAVGLGVMKVATIAAQIANEGLKASLLSNPITIIALLIGMLIGFIYKWVQSVGGIKIAWMIASNAILTAWDSIMIGFAKGTHAVLTYVGNLKVNVLTDLQDLANKAIDIINAFINQVNRIPGVSFDTISYVKFATEARIKNNAAIAARDKIISQAEDTARLNAMQRQYNIRAAQANATQNQLDNIYAGVSDIGANTGKMADAMEITEEDLKYLRDVAEREVIDRTVLRDIKVTLTNTFGDIRETADIDGIINKLETRLAEAIAIEAEGGSYV